MVGRLVRRRFGFAHTTIVVTPTTVRRPRSGLWTAPCGVDGRAGICQCHVLCRPKDPAVRRHLLEQRGGSLGRVPVRALPSVASHPALPSVCSAQRLLCPASALPSVASRALVVPVRLVRHPGALRSNPNARHGAV
jgi:hypothetical protein